MINIALIGAGGKMGFRLSANLAKSNLKVRHVEVSETGRKLLSDELGVTCVDATIALDGADVVILAVPDTLVGKISHELEPQLENGTMIIVLDVAAPFAGHLPDRDDLTFFITHPCHPPIFNDETDIEAKRDYFGGAKAKQGVVSALMQGPEEAYQLGEEIARIIYAPVSDCYRLTVEQMALLEPGLSEIVVATLLETMREAMDEVVSRGVPEAATRAFFLGHLNIISAVAFGEIEGELSDAAYKAIEFGKQQLLQPDWKKVFDKDAIAKSIQRIT